MYVLGVINLTLEEGFSPIRLFWMCPCRPEPRAYTIYTYRVSHAANTLFFFCFVNLNRVFV